MRIDYHIDSTGIKWAIIDRRYDGDSESSNYVHYCLGLDLEGQRSTMYQLLNKYYGTANTGTY